MTTMWCGVAHKLAGISCGGQLCRSNFFATCRSRSTCRNCLSVSGARAPAPSPSPSRASGPTSFCSSGLVARVVTDVRIGDDVQFGPNVQLLTPHPPRTAACEVGRRAAIRTDDSTRRRRRLRRHQGPVPANVIAAGNPPGSYADPLGNLTLQVCQSMSLEQARQTLTDSPYPLNRWRRNAVHATPGATSTTSSARSPKSSAARPLTSSAGTVTRPNPSSGCAPGRPTQATRPTRIKTFPPVTSGVGASPTAVPVREPHPTQALVSAMVGVPQSRKTRPVRCTGDGGSSGRPRQFRRSSCHRRHRAKPCRGA